VALVVFDIALRPAAPVMSPLPQTACALRELGECRDVDVPWERNCMLPTKQFPVDNWAWTGPTDAGCHQRKECPDAGLQDTEAHGSRSAKERGGQAAHGWHDKLSPSALRRRRRQKASGLVTERAAKRRGQGAAGGGSACAKPARGGSGKSVQCADLLEGLEAGGSLREAAAALRGRMVELSFDANGCWVAQKALAGGDVAVATELAAELRGHVREAFRSPHANYVVQKVIEVLPLSQSSFVADELFGMGAEVARHRYGCRVFCRLLEHSAKGAAAPALLEEVLREAGGLCRHSFGHYVMQHVLEHGTCAQRGQVLAALRSELARNVQSRNACYVIETAFTYGSPEDRAALIDDLLSGGPDRLAELAQHQSSSGVVRALLQTRGEGSCNALAQLQAAADQLQASKCGRKLLEEFGLGAC